MHASSKRSIPLRILVGVLLLGLAALAGFQHAELRRLQDPLATEARRFQLDEEFMRAWGSYFEALGGVPAGGDYEFPGMIRVNAARNWCVFKFTEESDAAELKKLMNAVAPRVIRGASPYLIDRIDTEWKRVSGSRSEQQTEIRDSFREPPDILVEFASLDDRGYIWIKTAPEQHPSSRQ